jgi:hypothetical protein
VKWVALLLHILEVPGWDIGSETCYLDLGVRGFPQYPDIPGSYFKDLYLPLSWGGPASVEESAAQPTAISISDCALNGGGGGLRENTRVWQLLMQLVDVTQHEVLLGPMCSQNTR